MIFKYIILTYDLNLVYYSRWFNILLQWINTYLSRLVDTWIFFKWVEKSIYSLILLINCSFESGTPDMHSASWCSTIYCAFVSLHKMLTLKQKHEPLLMSLGYNQWNGSQWLSNQPHKHVDYQSSTWNKENPVHSLLIMKLNLSFGNHAYIFESIFSLI